MAPTRRLGFLDVSSDRVTMINVWTGDAISQRSIFGKSKEVERKESNYLCDAAKDEAEASSNRWPIPAKCYN